MIARSFAMIRARAMIAMHRARRGDEFNPDQPRGADGKWGGGGASGVEKPTTGISGSAPGKAGAAERVEKAKATASQTATKASTAAVRHQAAQGKQRASKEAAVSALKTAKTAARVAKRAPTPDNVREWQAATKKAISARAQAAKHSAEAERASTANAKAQTAHALAQANLREAHRAAAAPAVTRAKAIELHPKGIGFQRMAGEHDTGAIEFTPSPEFSFGIGISAIRGRDEQPAVEHPRPAPAPPKKETSLEMLARRRREFYGERYVHKEVTVSERLRKQEENMIRAKRALERAAAPGISAAIATVSLPNLPSKQAGKTSKPPSKQELGHPSTSHDITQRLPTNWSPTIAPSVPGPRFRHPKNAASMAVTQRLPVV